MPACLLLLCADVAPPTHRTQGGQRYPVQWIQRRPAEQPAVAVLVVVCGEHGSLGRSSTSRRRWQHNGASQGWPEPTSPVEPGAGGSPGCARLGSRHTAATTSSRTHGCWLAAAPWRLQREAAAQQLQRLLCLRPPDNAAEQLQRLRAEAWGPSSLACVPAMVSFVPHGLCPWGSRGLHPNQEGSLRRTWTAALQHGRGQSTKCQRQPNDTRPWARPAQRAEHCGNL